jgi:hypothetical protein
VRNRCHLFKRGQPLLCFALFFLLATASGTIRSQSRSVRSVPDARTTRLAGLAKAWGAVKFFHPRLARTGIDWDRALIETIPKVNASHNSQEYVAALNAMFASLNDSGTRTRLRGDRLPKSAPGKPAEDREPVRMEADTLVIDAHAVANASNRQTTRRSELSANAGRLLANAKAVLIDLRSETSPDPDVVSDRDAFLRGVLSEILDHDVILAAQRYRIHNGYAPQRGTSSGGFYSGWVTQTTEILIGKSKIKIPPIVIMVNESSTSLDVVIGLQSGGFAYVLQEGAPPVSMHAATIALTPDVDLRISTTEIVDSHGVSGFLADEVVAAGHADSIAQHELAGKHRTTSHTNSVRASRTPASELDDAYPEMKFPPYEYRLLALFRYWNVINYFYPYKDLLGGDWNDVLARYIPRFKDSRNELEYETTLRELSVELHDSHGFMGPTMAFFEHTGAFVPPIVLRNVENQSMVALVSDPKVPVRVGDVILAIDGQSIASRREFFANHYPASTTQASMTMVQPYLLRGAKDSVAKLTVRGMDGATREARVVRTMDYFAPALENAFKRSSPSVAVLRGNVGYVDLDRLEKDDVNRMFETIKDTRAVIFDMRGYPHDTAWTIAPRLSKIRNPIAALFSRPMLEALTLGDADNGTPSYQSEQRLPDAIGQPYSGKVVMLINEEAASQAEHTCLFFEAATDVTFIGMPTAGVDGDATNLVLPGGIKASFSGNAVRHADGHQLQRVGIQPTIRVAPTIAGMAAGRDEVLEAALRYLATKQ